MNIELVCRNDECQFFGVAETVELLPVGSHFVAWPQLRCTGCNWVPWVVDAPAMPTRSIAEQLRDELKVRP